MDTPGALFEAAAATLLQAYGRGGAPDAAALALLRALGCPLPRGEPGEPERHRARLFRAAARFLRLFRLESGDTPGLAAFGAEVDPTMVAAEPGLPVMGVSGTGPTLLEAFEACVGEGVEMLSQVETAEDRAALQPSAAAPGEVPPTVGTWLRAVLPADATWTEGPWLRVRRAADGQDVALPADLCLRRPASRRAFDPPWPLSIGCAAGPTAEAAALHGLLELVERDAAALWWRGGQCGRPVAIEEPASQEAVALIAALRQGRSPRRGWLLDITTDLGVPVVAALSFGPAGDGFCCGLAARPTLHAAARAAVLEMAQMELAHAVVQAKRRERGDAGLNPADQAHLRRFAGIDAGRCALVHPLGPCRAAAADLPAASAAEALGAVRGRMAAAGLEEVLTLDLTRTAFGIPVVRTLCPGLEVEPSRLAGPRLRAAIARTGGGGCQTGELN